MVQLHLGDQLVYYILRCALLERFDGTLSRQLGKMTWNSSQILFQKFRLYFCKYWHNTASQDKFYANINTELRFLHISSAKGDRHASIYILLWYHTYTILLYRVYIILCMLMMTSSNGNIFRVTGHLWGEFIGPRWIPRTKASDAELWCFLWSAPK